jgi:saccharopine dehydrogenase-like NADP-dependent oxidoreductase
MPQCGLAPGFIGIVAHHLAQKLRHLHDVKMRVGALPAFPTNALKYNLTWSVDGLINEYCHPCEAIRDGDASRCCRSKAWSTSAWTAPSTRPSTPRAAWARCATTLAGRVRTLDYKSVRYPGHRALMKLLLEDLQLARPADAEGHPAQEHARHHAGRGAGVRHRQRLRGGQLLQEVFARKIFADRSRDNPLSAIQITTAAGICAAVDLFREGKLPQRGFIRQEQVALPDFLANRFGKAYQQSARWNRSADPHA